jgi:hypothetical protein
MAEVDTNYAAFGPAHDLFFLRKDSNDIPSVFRVDYETGNESRALPGPIADIYSVSHDGDWAILGVPKAKPWTVARPLRGGNDIPSL